MNDGVEKEKNEFSGLGEESNGMAEEKRESSEEREVD